MPKRSKLPGYIAFTVSVFRIVLKYWRPFLLLLTLYVLVSLLIVGFTQQDQFRSLTEAIDEINKEAGEDVLGGIYQVAGIFGVTLMGSLNSSLSEIQQFYMAIIYTMTWLILIWLLRHLMAGNVVRVRDAVYNAGAPLVSSICILALMLLQALPGAIGLFIFSIATQNSIFSDGVSAMCFGILALLLVVMSLYWLTSSFFAFLIVTIPGTYPMSAVRGAADLALGRRTQLLIRLIWLLLLIVLIWAILVIPALFIDDWLNVSWLPLVTIMVQVATAISFIVSVTYIYTLYRRMIDDPAK